MEAVRRAAVIGTGTMGPGMGAVLARAGIETALYDVSAEALDELHRDALPRTLVGGGGVGEPVADDPSSRRERRADDAMHVIGARRKQQQRLGDRRKRYAGVLDEVPDPFRGLVDVTPGRDEARVTMT